MSRGVPFQDFGVLERNFMEKKLLNDFSEKLKTDRQVAGSSSRCRSTMRCGW